MRIRTVKPEFWSHPVLSRMTDEVRLAAIGLLNIADDEGYFLAEPPVVRSALFPFDEDSSRTRRILDALSRIAYIERVEHPEQGKLARIVNFTKHQRIDRPSPSKIKDYFNSTNVRRMIVEDSLLEQGTGNREQGTGKGSLPPASAVGSSEDLRFDSEEAPKPSKQPRQRDPLFDALASVDGSSPTEITPTYARQVGVSLAEIRKATPAVTPDEIRRRAANYVTHFRDAALTPSALKVHWSRCANSAKQSGNGHASQLPEGRDEDGNPLW